MPSLVMGGGWLLTWVHCIAFICVGGSSKRMGAAVGKRCSPGLFVRLDFSFFSFNLTYFSPLQAGGAEIIVLDVPWLCADVTIHIYTACGLINQP